MSRVIPAYVFQAKQHAATASARFEEENQHLEARMSAAKCCEVITTGAHP